MDRGATIDNLIARPDVRYALRAWIDERGTLIDAAAARPGAEALRGRDRIYMVPAPERGSRWVVRHYHRGGAIASVLGDRYLRLGTPRPFREYRIGRALEELEVPTVPHLGAAVYPAGPWYRGDLVTELVPDSTDLAAVLFPRAVKAPAPGRCDVEPTEAMEAAGRLVRLLHDRGVVHPDLHLRNILLTGRPPRALVVDLDKARVRMQVDERARRRMLDRFWRSARKWERRATGSLAPQLREAFRAGYG
jgi:3-deoxy-D-manno-octulosonic acid kinase